MATFDPIFAADPNNPELIAADASITIFDPDDPGMEPVLITDATGSPLENPITVNDKGWGPAIKTPTGPGELFRIGWSGAGFTGFFTSYEGMRDATLTAKASAESAASGAAEAAIASAAAQTAATAAEDSAAAAASTAATAATAAVASTLAATVADSETAAAAATAAQAAAEAAASVTASGGFAVDPSNANVLLISTLADGTVAVDPTNSNVLLITT